MCVSVEKSGRDAPGRGASGVSDDDDDFQDIPAPRQPEQLREYSDEEEDVIVQEAPRVSHLGIYRKISSERQVHRIEPRTLVTRSA